MVRNTNRTISIRLSQDNLDEFNESFEASGTNSKGEFVTKLLDKWNENEVAPEPVIETVTVEKELQENQLLLSLLPAQMFALRGTILGRPDFAENQNEIIDSLKGDPPFLSFSKLYKPEFHNIWVKNILIKKDMLPEDKERAVRHNMTAFLINMFMVNVIEENISSTNITARHLQEYIQKTTQLKKEVPNQLKAPQDE